MLESVLESDNYSSESADSNAYSPKIDVWVRVFTQSHGEGAGAARDTSLSPPIDSQLFLIRRISLLTACTAGQ